MFLALLVRTNRRTHSHTRTKIYSEMKEEKIWAGSLPLRLRLIKLKLCGPHVDRVGHLVEQRLYYFDSALVLRRKLIITF